MIKQLLISFLLDELHQSHRQYFAKLFHVVYDQEILEWEIRHVVFNFHFAIYVVNRFNS